MREGVEKEKGSKKVYLDLEFLFGTRHKVSPRGHVRVPKARTRKCFNAYKVEATTLAIRLLS